MAEPKNGCPTNSTAFKEAVCIDAGRVYDSCCDRDCLEDLRCYFSPDAQEAIEHAHSARLRSAEVLTVETSVDPVTFNKGYYSCDLTFFFLCDFDLYTMPNICPIGIKGITAFQKKVILYGSDGNVKVFGDEGCDRMPELRCQQNSTAPRCVVQCVDPVCLSCRIGELNDCFDNIVVPQQISNFVGGNVVTAQAAGTPTIFATLGLFTIVQLIRNVQMLVPVYDFCIPEKQCEDPGDQPCDIFRQIKFPTDDFFPPHRTDAGGGCGSCQPVDFNG